MHDRVKFYSTSDYSSGFHLRRVKEIVDQFNSNKVDYDVNEIIEFFPNQEVRFKVGIETFDDDYRIKILKKNFILNDYTQLSNFYSCCLLICTNGQTKEQISNDIETALKYFKEITGNCP